MPFPYATARQLLSYCDRQQVLDVFFESMDDMEAADLLAAAWLADQPSSDSDNPPTGADNPTPETRVVSAGMADALDWAHSEADTFLSRQYPLPLLEGQGVSTAPRVLVERVLSIARAYLYGMNGRIVFDSILEDAEKAQEWFLMVSRRQVQLFFPRAEGDAAPPPGRIYRGVRQAKPGIATTGSLPFHG